MECKNSYENSIIRENIGNYTDILISMALTSTFLKKAKATPTKILFQPS